MLPGSECYTYTFHSRHDSADLIHPRSPRCHWPGVTSGWGGASAAPIHNPRRPAEAPARRGTGTGTPERTDGGRSASRPGVAHRRPSARRAGDATWTRRAPETQEEGWGPGRQPAARDAPGLHEPGTPPLQESETTGSWRRMPENGEARGRGLGGPSWKASSGRDVSPPHLNPLRSNFLVGFVFNI